MSGAFSLPSALLRLLTPLTTPAVWQYSLQSVSLRLVSTLASLHYFSQGALLLEKTAGLRLLWGYCGERGRVSMYSTPSAYGLVFSWKGRNHTVEQEAPFDADEVITKASEWADKLENSGLPKGWSRTP
jgi:hypothetical protein